MWINVFFYRCSPDQIARLKEVGGGVRETILSQPGCHLVEFCKIEGEEDLYFLVETWDSREAFKAYEDTVYRAFGSQVESLMEHVSLDREEASGNTIIS